MEKIYWKIIEAICEMIIEEKGSEELLEELQNAIHLMRDSEHGERFRP